MAELGDTKQRQLDALLEEITACGLDLQLAGILPEPGVAVELKKLEIMAPPKMAWALIGIPIQDFSSVQPQIRIRFATSTPGSFRDGAT